MYCPVANIAVYEGVSIRYEPITKVYKIRYEYGDLEDMDDSDIKQYKVSTK